MIPAVLVGPMVPRIDELRLKLCPGVPTVIALPAGATVAQRQAASAEITAAIVAGALAALDRLDVDLSLEEAT